MRRRAAILVLAGTLGGCLTPSAYRQSNALIGQPIGEAVARYGPPDQPVVQRAGSYSWSHGEFAGACRLSVRTDARSQITHADVVAIGFKTCKTMLAHARDDAKHAR